jgi:hypothetical protein
LSWSAASLSSNYPAALANQLPRLGEISGIFLIGMCIGYDGKQCEADGE